VRTLFERGALWTLVRRRYADRSPREQARAYRRLQGKRRRLVLRFRRRLRHEVCVRRGSEATAAVAPECVVSTFESLRAVASTFGGM